jgi:allophanate hydrolase
VPTNPFDARYICGGSSSGSAAAVALGLVSFALGTDTAGSGRVPAAFTNTVGLKPSRGVLSAAGVVPACRSLDCVSVLALTVTDAAQVAQIARGYDAADPWSRPEADRVMFAPGAAPASFRFGVPAEADLEFFGDTEAARLFAESVARLTALGGHVTRIAFEPFREAARLLYEGPWLAERLSGLQEFVDQRPGSVLPVTLQILRGGSEVRTTDAFRAFHRIEALKQTVRALWRQIDLLVVPSAPTIYRIDEVLADPIRLNSRLGIYTNFANLLDLSALAVPAGFRGDRLPAGVTLLAPWGRDAALAAVGDAFQRAPGASLGATGWPLPPVDAPSVTPPDRMRLAVVGAHLSGMPLNHQLVDLGGRLVRACQTAARYRLFALPNTTPPKPGMVKVADGGEGVAIEVEVWELPRDAFGAFFRGVVAPLCIGTLELDDGEQVAGFLCEAHATTGARDISELRGWRRYMASRG